MTFGPTFLSQEELSGRIKDQLTSYYQYLADSVFAFREKEFWAYHRAKMESAGYPLSLLRLFTAVCSKTMDCLLNPKRTVEGLLEKSEKPGGGSESR